MSVAAIDYTPAFWTSRLREFIPAFLAEHDFLRDFAPRATIIFHGSMAQGRGDRFSDLDLWLLLPGTDVQTIDARAGTRFFEFHCDGVIGHLNAEPIEEFVRRVNRCDMDALYQLRRGAAVADPTGAGERLVAIAREPMPDAVSRAFFFHHYVEMRSEHRACDTPIERNDPAALLFSLPKAIAHALRAAMVLHGEPYPYDKWLFVSARATPTGCAVAEHIDRIVDLLGTGALRIGGPEREHPLGLELRAIRAILQSAAREHGIDEPWLTQWWLHMDQARDAIRNIRWKAGS